MILLHLTSRKLYWQHTLLDGFELGMLLDDNLLNHCENMAQHKSIFFKVFHRLSQTKPLANEVWKAVGS